MKSNTRRKRLSSILLDRAKNVINPRGKKDKNSTDRRYSTATAGIYIDDSDSDTENEVTNHGIEVVSGNDYRFDSLPKDPPYDGMLAVDEEFVSEPVVAIDSLEDLTDYNNILTEKEIVPDPVEPMGHREDILTTCILSFLNLWKAQAYAWNWNHFTSVTQQGHGPMWCNRRHLLGSTRSTSLVSNQKFPISVYPDKVDSKADIADHPRSVVLVGLYNIVTQRITNIGSGFIVNKKRGFIMTAAHTLMEIQCKKNFGDYYCGKEGRVVIGVIPDNGYNNETKAVFRYFAKIVAKDKMVYSKEKRCEIDACILQITTRMESDVDGKGDECGKQAELPIMSGGMIKEDLKELKIAKCDCEVSDYVHVIGFNQGGDGFQTESAEINRNFDVTRGHVSIVKLESNTSMVTYAFSPRTEIVVNFECMPGHSGSACMNKEGKVIGMVSRGKTGCCFLVPRKNLKTLLRIAELSIN